MTLLQVEGLSKVYPDGTKALDNLDLTINPGEFVVVIGPSGAGKSTLLRSLNRMIEPTNGKIQFKGSETMGIKGKRLRELRRHMGMIFQGYNLVTRVSVLRNVLHGRLGYMNAFKGALGLFSKSDTEAAKKNAAARRFVRTDVQAGRRAERWTAAAGRYCPRTCAKTRFDSGR